MLGWRLLLSALIIPALVGVFWLDARQGASAPLLFVLALGLAARCAWEMVHLLRTRNLAPSLSLTMLCTLLVVAAGWFGRFGSSLNSTDAEIAAANAQALAMVALAFAFAVLLLFLGEAIRYREPGRSMESLGAGMTAVAYVGVLLAVTAQLRWIAGAEAGYLVLGSVIVATKCGDVGGYTLGRMFGRRKMFPRLSPGKTWMGGLGAVLGSGLATWAWLHFGPPLFNAQWRPSPPLAAIGYGVIVGVVGLVGDVCESLIKRDVGKKDAAPLMPGFGGLLDLLDSVLYAGPVAYVLWQVLPLATWQ